jgi:thioredoxin-like negative regulator of GroEL
VRILGPAVGVLALLGCGLTRGPLPELAPDTPVPSVASTPSAPAADPAGDPLTLAAECMERGDESGAAIHLEAYVRGRPEHLMFRAQLAEMLVRVGRDADAKAHYERFAADAQAATGAVRGRLVTAHTRLMEIAQRDHDRFGELFHRGVGLLLLAKEQDKLADGDPAFGEEMLCKALKALAEARDLRPSDARVRAYLAEAHERTGNRRAADAERAATRERLVPGQLTAAERRGCLVLEGGGR